MYIALVGIEPSTFSLSSLKYHLGCFLFSSVLSTIDMVYEKLGSLIESYLPKLLQLVVCIGASCNALLSLRGSIAAKSVMALKKVRQDAQMRIMEVSGEREKNVECNNFIFEYKKCEITDFFLLFAKRKFHESMGPATTLRRKNLGNFEK